MSKPTVIEEVFAVVKRVAPDASLYVAYCATGEHKDIPQISSSEVRFCSMCGLEIKGTLYQPDVLDEKGAA